MSWTSADLIVHAMRRRAADKALAPAEADEHETGHGGLQEKIAKFCREQSPMLPFLQARADQPSTLAKGAQDFTIFLPSTPERKRVLCVEAKARGKKRKPEQLAWAMLMEMVGHKVHLCYSMEEFMAALREEMQ